MHADVWGILPNSTEALPHIQIAMHTSMSREVDVQLLPLPIIHIVMYILKLESICTSPLFIQILSVKTKEEDKSRLRLQLQAEVCGPGAECQGRLSDLVVTWM